MQQLLRCSLVGMSGSNVDSLLKRIASDKTRQDVEESYMAVDETMKHTGRPTNNMLLSAIHSEIKRNTDETLRLNVKMNSVSDNVIGLFSEMKRMCSLVETQNEILSSMALAKDSEQSEVVGTQKQNTSGDWWLQGTKFTSKYHVYAGIILHLIDMVQVHMDLSGQHYPDSVDCDMNTMQNAVRVISTERCRIQSVEYKNTIPLKEKDNQAIRTILPRIATTNKEVISLSESMLHTICTPITRGVMQDVEWIRQRLCHLDGILSLKQIDVMRSIRHPIMKPDSDSELNWDYTIIRPRSSHPLAKDIADLLKLQKDEYMKLRMAGQNIETAYENAKDFSSSKSKAKK